MSDETAREDARIMPTTALQPEVRPTPAIGRAIRIYSSVCSSVIESLTLPVVTCTTSGSPWPSRFVLVVNRHETSI